jgi:hypothetical protein
MDVPHEAEIAPDLWARHHAAVSLLRRGIVTDGELLLSYVVDPTQAVERAVARAARAAAAASPPRRPRRAIAAV